MIVWFVDDRAPRRALDRRVPGVLAAMNPSHAAEFFAANGYHGFVVLGAVFLVVTGGEALYADMGHFGAGPIRLAWFGMVMPGLLLNYFGQGALLLANPEAAESPFYHLAPAPLVLPLVILATAAATIASQALISAVFSLTRQAVQLGYSPRVEIRHTSATTIGQIYVPTVNWLLAIATITLVLTFQSSSALAAAYGIAVTATMAITTVLAYVVARQVWHWSRWAAGSVTAVFVIVDLAFFGANALKILHGGWVPLVHGVGGVSAVLDVEDGPADSGRAPARARVSVRSVPEGPAAHPSRIACPARAIFMTGSGAGVPPTLHSQPAAQQGAACQRRAADGGDRGRSRGLRRTSAWSSSRSGPASSR